MFNTTNNTLKLGSNTQLVTFNTPSTGLLQKSHPRSTFIRFKKGSTIETQLFPTDGINEPELINEKKESRYDTYSNRYYDHINKIITPITILQILVFGDDYFLCEIVKNEYLKDEESL